MDRPEWAVDHPQPTTTVPVLPLDGEPGAPITDPYAWRHRAYEPMTANTRTSDLTERVLGEIYDITGITINPDDRAGRAVAEAIEDAAGIGRDSVLAPEARAAIEAWRAVDEDQRIEHRRTLEFKAKEHRRNAEWWREHSKDSAEQRAKQAKAHDTAAASTEALVKLIEVLALTR